MKYRNVTGTCRWCGQIRTIMKAPENATQDELDRIASDECTCDGANKERKIREMISTAESSILKVVTKRAPGAAQILEAGVEQVARGYAKKVSVNVDGMLTASMYRSGDRIVVESRKTEVYIADGETVDDPAEPQNPGK